MRNHPVLSTAVSLAAALIPSVGFADADPPDRPNIVVFHNEDAEVYVNGRQVARLTGHTTIYEQLPLGNREAAALRSGSKRLAVHCRQTTGGQYIDVAVVDTDRPQPTTIEHLHV